MAQSKKKKRIAVVIDCYYDHIDINGNRRERKFKKDEVLTVDPGVSGDYDGDRISKGFLKTMINNKQVKEV